MKHLINAVQWITAIAVLSIASTASADDCPVPDTSTMLGKIDWRMGSFESNLGDTPLSCFETTAWANIVHPQEGTWLHFTLKSLSHRNRPTTENIAEAKKMAEWLIGNGTPLTGDSPAAKSNQAAIAWFETERTDLWDEWEPVFTREIVSETSVGSFIDDHFKSQWNADIHRAHLGSSVLIKSGWLWEVVFECLAPSGKKCEGVLVDTSAFDKRAWEYAEMIYPVNESDNDEVKAAKETARKAVQGMIKATLTRSMPTADLSVHCNGAELTSQKQRDDGIESGESVTFKGGKRVNAISPSLRNCTAASSHPFRLRTMSFVDPSP